MTDPVARDNFIKYGHPDGWGHFNVGIALPETLQDKDQQIFVLVMFLIIFGAVNGYFFQELTKEETDIGGVSMDNRELFRKMLDHDTMGNKIPAILSQGEDLIPMKVNSKKELELIKKIKEHS